MHVHLQEFHVRKTVFMSLCATVINNTLECETVLTIFPLIFHTIDTDQMLSLQAIKQDRKPVFKLSNLRTSKNTNKHTQNKPT